MLDAETRVELAANLADAERSKVPMAPLTAGSAEGARVVGHKVGLSPEAMQQMMGVIATPLTGGHEDHVRTAEQFFANGAVLTCDGAVVAEGRSDAVLGNPVTAVAWLTRKVDSFDVRLKAGDVVLPGSCTQAIDAHPGDHFVADFAKLGSVGLTFE
jgi:2-keto-4-pentenoate hydratase